MHPFHHTTLPPTDKPVSIIFNYKRREMQESLDIKRGNKCAYFLLYFIVQMKTLVPIYQTLFESS